LLYEYRLGSFPIKIRGQQNCILLPDIRHGFQHPPVSLAGLGFMFIMGVSFRSSLQIYTIGFHPVSNPERKGRAEKSSGRSLWPVLVGRKWRVT
jgi:hypothetical protein